MGELDPLSLFSALRHCACLALAVSGGPDSMALLALAAEWARLGPTPRLIVYSVDHGLRAAAADEAATAIAAARRLGLAGRVLAWEGDKPKAGLQAAARAARYRLMAAAMRDDGAERLLTAHHRGDQAETIMMRLAHGSGIHGLRGMDRFTEIEGCPVARPLLDVEPSALAARAEAAGLPVVNDPSNADPRYERVRWREWLRAASPLGLTGARLGAFAARMAAAADLVEEATDVAERQLLDWRDPAAIEILRAPLAALNPLVAARLLGRVVQRVSGDARPPALDALEALAAAVAAERALKPRTLHGCVIASRGTMLAVRREPPRRARQGR